MDMMTQQAKTKGVPVAAEPGAVHWQPHVGIGVMIFGRASLMIGRINKSCPDDTRA